MSNIQKNTALLYLHPMLTGNLLLWTSTGPPYRIPQKKGKARLLRLPAGYYHIKWRYHKGLFQTQLRLQKGQKLSLHSILKQRSNHYKYRNFPSRGKQQKKLTSQAHTQSPSGTQQKFAKTPSSNWSFFIEGGPVGALMLGNIISAGGSFGLQHRFFGIRLGTWGTSVPYGKKHLNLHIALQIDLGYRWDWGMFSFFVGGYGGVGWLFQDIGIATLSGPLLHFGVTLSPGIWFSRRWGLVLRLNLGGDSGLFGGDLRIYLRWHTGLGVQFRL